MATDQMALIAADPRVMHGQAVIAGTRVPVSVILDCLAAGMAARRDRRRIPRGQYCGRARGGRLRRGTGARGTAAAAAVAVKFKLDENLPASSAAILAGAGHDVDTVGQETLTPSARRG